MTDPHLGTVVGLGLWRLRHNIARPDIVGPDQPELIDPLGVGEMPIVVLRRAHAREMRHHAPQEK